MTDSEATVYAYVCLARTPPNGIRAKLRAFEELGWRSVDNPAPEILRLRKQVDRPLPAETIEQEIRQVMGDSYLGLAEVGAPGSTFGGSAAEPSSHEDALERERTLLRTLEAEGWRLTNSGKMVLEGNLPTVPMTADLAVEAEGGAQLAIKPVDERRNR